MDIELVNEVAECKTYYDDLKGTTFIYIIYNGFSVMSMELYGQLQPAAVKEYALEAIELLKKKGVIKDVSHRSFKRQRY